MSTLDLVIANGRAVSPWGTAVLDIGVAEGRIRELATSPGHLDARRTVDAEGMLVLPGGVDPHVHFENPSMGTETAHDFGIGTEAAALGGTTTVIDFAFQAPGETPLETLRRRKAVADQKVAIDYSLHGCITRADARSLDDIPQMAQFGAPSTKVFMVYRDEGWMVEDGNLVDVMRRMRAVGGTLLIHAENDGLLQWGVARCLADRDMGAGGHARSRPPLVEAEAIQRAGLFSLETGCPVYVVHMSSAAGLASLRVAQREGAQMYSETCGHYLTLNETFLDGPRGYRYVMSPPLRSAADQESLWTGLSSGAIEAIGSDDAAYVEQYKVRGADDFRHIANGIPGAQIRLPLLFSEGVVKHRLTLERFVDAVSTQPARLFGLYPQKGVLSPGSDADIVVYDPETRWRPTPDNMRTNIEYTCYEHLEIIGRPVHVWCRGQQVVESGQFVGQRGYGQFLARTPRGEEASR